MEGTNNPKEHMNKLVSQIYNDYKDNLKDNVEMDEDLARKLQDELWKNEDNDINKYINQLDRNEQYINDPN